MIIARHESCHGLPYREEKQMAIDESQCLNVTFLSRSVTAADYIAFKMTAQTKLIMVLGLPGTGKTTFARELAKVLQCTHLNTDRIREQLGMRGRYDHQSKQVVYDALIAETRNFLQTEQPVIVDATFHKRKLRKPFVEMAQSLHVPFYWIELSADESVIRKRVGKKRKYSEADFSVYQKIKAGFEPLLETKLVLSSDRKTVDELISKAIKYLLNEKRTDRRSAQDP